MKAKRPRRVTLTAVGVLSIAGLYLVRFLQATEQWQFLASLPNISPVYIMLTGLLWAATGLPLAVGLWLGAGWARPALLVWAPAFILYAWADRIFVSNLPFIAWPFWLAVTLLTLGLVFWIFTRGKGKAFFRRNV